MVMNKTPVFSAQRSTSFQIKLHENRQSNTAWKQWLEWLKCSPEYRTLYRIDGEPIVFEWNVFPGFNTLQLSQEVQELLLRLNETPENFTRRIIFMSMFNDISWGSKDNEKECKSNAQLVSLFEKEAGHPFMIERRNPLWEDSRVPHSCQARLKAVQRIKQNHKDEILPTHPQELLL